jgi:glutathione peroxidase
VYTTDPDMTMKAFLTFLLLPLYCFASAAFADESTTCGELLDYKMRPLGESEPVDLCALYRGKVVMIVNTASRCGFTPQYEALEGLYRRYGERGFVVLGFPSNDFGNQEPGTEEEIRSFCELTYEIGFPMFEKTRTARDNADPIYQGLAEASGTYPTWNFYKYVLDRDGSFVKVFPSRVKPDSSAVVGLLESLL